MAQIKILLAEDDQNAGAVLKAYLEDKGYVCSLADDGVSAFNLFLEDDYSICILDVTMPKKDGFMLAKDIRAVDKNVPIVFLTARAQEEDKLKGFSLGADDYVTKPFSMDELNMRIKAILRRVKRECEFESIYEFSNFSFDFNRQILTYTDPETNNVEEMKLTSKESSLLRIFCHYPNQIISRTTILQKVWRSDSYFNARSMDVYITKLRKYVRRDKGVDIVNQHGVGFKLAFTPNE